MSYHHTHPSRRRVAAWLAAAAVTALAVAQSAGRAGATTPDFDADAYCAASLAIENAPEPEIDWESATDEEIIEAGRAYAVEVLRPLADDLFAAAPAELADAAATFDAAISELEETGEFTALETAELAAVEAQAHTFDLETCDWNVVDVEAADYRFDNMPDELAAGVTSFEMNNVGSEPHELVIFRLADEATQPIEELLALPDDEIDEFVTFAAAAMAEPGGSDYAVAELEPGRHVAICFLPVDGEEGGAPHFVEGMLAEFTVVA